MAKRDVSDVSAICEPDSGRVSGVGICGVGAGELISEGVLAVEMGAVAEDLAGSIHRIRHSAKRSWQRPLSSMDRRLISTRPTGDGRPVIRLLDLTLPTPIENLALDEALLEELEERGGHPVLRLWESDRHFVVLGRACRTKDDVHIEICERDGLPILRRASGGGTVLLGPGCLAYALVLPVDLHPNLASIRGANRFILERIAGALRRWEGAVACRGVSDLAIGERKISGNAQRRTRHALLFHGTILYRMPAEVIARYLRHPRRQPAYRADRPHDSFVCTIPAPSPAIIKEALADVWGADTPLDSWPSARMLRAVAAVERRSGEEPAPSTASRSYAGCRTTDGMIPIPPGDAMEREP